MNYIQIPNGLRLAVEDEGTGTVLFFVHGVAESMLVWKYAVAELKKYFRCIRIDLPGHGHSWDQRGSFSMSFYSDCILGCLDALKLEEVNYVGHSMGAQIGMITALRAPSRFGKLIFAAPAGIETFTAEEKKQLVDWSEKTYSQPGIYTQLQYWMRQQLRSRLEESDELVAAQMLQQSPERFRLWRETILDSIKGMLAEPVSAFLPEIKNKTLLLFGENDNLIPNKFLHPALTIESLALTGTALFQDAELVYFENCGHYLPFEKAERFAEEVRRFLR